MTGYQAVAKILVAEMAPSFSTSRCGLRDQFGLGFTLRQIYGKVA